MEKRIVTWSYWLGVASTVIALVLKFKNTLSVLLAQVGPASRNVVSYLSFYRAAVLFFLIGVATASYTWTRNQKSQ